jgi:hypothetical protein
MSKIFIVFSAVTFIFQTQSFAAKKFEIHGGQAGASRFEAQKSELEKVCGCELSITTSTADLAMGALDRGIASAALIGASLEATIQKASEKMKKQLDIKDYESVSMGSDPVYLYLHPDNPSTKLTDEQIKDIMTGKIANWESINGMKEPVSVLVSTTYRGSHLAIVDTYLSGDPIKAHTFEATTSPGFLNRLKLTKGAVGIAAVIVGANDFKPRSLLTKAKISVAMVAKKPIAPEMQKLMDYYKKKNL